MLETLIFGLPTRQRASTTYVCLLFSFRLWRVFGQVWHLGEIRVSGSARIARQTMYGNMQVDEEDDDDENDDSDITADDDGTRKVGDGAV